VIQLAEQNERHSQVWLMRHAPESYANELRVKVQTFGNAFSFAFRALPRWVKNRILGLG